ncbi:hypothetical protein [Stenotrophomonas sp. PS02298]|uniref:crAss001_48 related protein n=1 Tax=Stenotrophomonas sp. PS02298 TaxID=2991424 RepID=UPI00249C465D|nr:hypothetical protein [Stenotrophomonas sp. PS02298]
MTRQAYNDYRGWTLPADENGDDPGYMVEYLDGGKPNHADHVGYISWSPQAQFDAAYLTLGDIGHLPPHVQRLVAELEQLGDRIDKLGKFQGTDVYASLPEDERKDLDTQAKCMIGYSNVLLGRVNRARGQHERAALTQADAEADAAGVTRPDNPGLNTNTVALEKAASVGKSETGVAMQAKPSVDMAQQVRDREVSGRALGAALGAGAAQLSIGRLVHYVLSLEDAAKINGVRTNGAAIQDRILEDKWSIGAQAHIGNTVSAGDVLPAMVVRVLPCQQANLQVFLDGNDVFWATSRAEAAPGRTEPGRWHWPARV